MTEVKTSRTTEQDGNNVSVWSANRKCFSLRSNSVNEEAAVKSLGKCVRSTQPWTRLAPANVQSRSIIDSSSTCMILHQIWQKSFSYLAPTQSGISWREIPHTMGYGYSSAVWQLTFYSLIRLIFKSHIISRSTIWESIRRRQKSWLHVCLR